MPGNLWPQPIQHQPMPEGHGVLTSGLKRIAARVYMVVCSAILGGPVKYVLAFGASDFDGTTVGRYAQFGLALGTFHYPVIDQLQDPGLIQTHHHILTYQYGWYATQTAAGELGVGLRIVIYILFGKTDFVLGKKLFRRFAMGSGLGGEQYYLLHEYASLHFDGLFQELLGLIEFFFADFSLGQPHLQDL